jgi:copper oxidase (laccase) domain-containing protein
MAAIHAGWKGTAGKLVQKTLNIMAQTWGTRGEDCWAMVGACIGPDAFEVGPEVAEKFEPAFKRWDEKRGKFVVDLKKANAAQLHAFGIPEDQTDVWTDCTVVNNRDYFSHRAEKGTTGRMFGFIGMEREL